jgi:PTH2 family peptidyl-tRNA hydrolase
MFHSERSGYVEHKQTLVLRKDLNMRQGMMVTQGVHAAMLTLLLFGSYEEERYIIPIDQRLRPWLLGRLKTSCVSVDSEAELLALHQQCKASGLVSALVRDAGITGFGGIPAYTALAVGPGRADQVDAITSGLPLL